MTDIQGLTRLEGLFGFDPFDFVSEVKPHVADMPKCIQRDYLRLAVERIDQAARKLLQEQDAGSDDAALVQETKNLASALYNRFYWKRNSKGGAAWTPLGDVRGLLSQIDNITAGLMPIDDLTSALSEASAIRSGPDGKGGITVSINFPTAGSESGLYYLLTNAAANRTQQEAAA